MIRTLWRRANVASACRRSSSKVMVVGLWEPLRPNPPPSGPLCSPGAGLSRSKRGQSRSTPSGPLPGPLGGGDKWLACRRPRKTARHSELERNRACRRRRPVAARAAAGRATGASHSGLNRPSFGRAEGPSPGRSRDKQLVAASASNAIRRRLALRLAGMAKAAYRTGATCVKRAWRGGFGQKRLKRRRFPSDRNRTHGPSQCRDFGKVCAVPSRDRPYRRPQPPPQPPSPRLIRLYQRHLSAFRLIRIASPEICSRGDRRR